LSQFAGIQALVSYAAASILAAFVALHPYSPAACSSDDSSRDLPQQRLLLIGSLAGGWRRAQPRALSRDQATQADSVDLPRALGLLLVGRFAGPRPSNQLLTRIRHGELGGITLFSDNVSNGPVATRGLITLLQRSAEAGRNPPLLIMTDQEGGTVKRLPGPPDLSPEAMTSTSVAEAQGRSTGQFLRTHGINVDLAPVADVKSSPALLLGTRSFGTTPASAAARAAHSRQDYIWQALATPSSTSRALGEHPPARIWVQSS